MRDPRGCNDRDRGCERTSGETSCWARAGDYVQILRIVLEPGERAPQVPEDTREVPLELRVKGFIDHDARLGDEVTIATVLGRKVTGRLVAVNPAYPHGFGRPAPELLRIGQELRDLLGARQLGARQLGTRQLGTRQRRKGETP